MNDYDILDRNQHDHRRIPANGLNDLGDTVIRRFRHTA
tara:strand:- start:4094 stop:4207 length:114 start_codon:yes stop_codon:yes gene_type:complete